MWWCLLHWKSRQRYVLLNNIADTDIWCHVLSTDNIQMKPVTDVITFVENKKTAQNANPSTSISAWSAYRCDNNQASQKGPTDGPHKNCASFPSDINKSRTAICPDCNSSIFLKRSPEDGIANHPHTVRPTGIRTAKATKGANKINQAWSAAPALIYWDKSLLSAAVPFQYYLRSLPSLNYLSRHHWNTKSSAKANGGMLRLQPIPKSTYA